MIEVEGAARYFEYYGNQAETVEGRSIPGAVPRFHDLRAFGVSAQIIPWNYPVEMTARYCGGAGHRQCRGETPELDPLAMLAGTRREAAGLPDGALDILAGHEAGAALAGHPDISNVVFTGSVETGIKVATAAAVM